jgi:hypothetical protein
MRAYGDCLSATSTREAPWYIVPPTTEDARLIVSEVLLSALKGAETALSKPAPNTEKNGRRPTVPRQ